MKPTSKEVGFSLTKGPITSKTIMRCKIGPVCIKGKAILRPSTAKVQQSAATRHKSSMRFGQSSSWPPVTRPHRLSIRSPNRSDRPRVPPGQDHRHKPDFFCTRMPLYSGFCLARAPQAVVFAGRQPQTHVRTAVLLHSGDPKVQAPDRPVQYACKRDPGQIRDHHHACQWLEAPKHCEQNQDHDPE
jgi:hypothetical protein